MIFERFLSKTNVRSAKAFKNIISTFIIKGFSIVINLALIPLTINYLNPTKYGVWLTISSILGWISFFDMGLGHGLRNKLAESISRNEIERAKSYVSTAYISIAILCFVLFGIFSIINHFLNWNTLLNIPAGMDEDMKSIALMLFSMFSIQFILQLINSIFLGSQQPAKVSFNNMLSNLLVLIGIYILTQFTKASLLNIAFVFSIIPVMVLVIMSIYYFNTSFKKYSPSLKYFDSKSLKDVLNLGVKFFIIQISVMIFFQTSNLLISRYFSPEMVTPYNIAYKYFGITSMIFSIITAPYWSAYTEAYTKQDFAWIKKSINQLVKIWGGLVVLAILMLVFSEYAYHLWVGDKVKVDFKISLFMMLYFIIVSYGGIYLAFLNGIGNIKSQMIVNIIGMIIFIPLAHFLAVTINLGIIGIIISTIVCGSYGPLIAPFQVKKILSKYD